MAIDQRDVSSTLRFMDDRALQQYAAMHKNDPYIFPLAFQESQNRQKLRMSQQGAQGMQPQPKVADQALAQMAPQMLPEEQGIGALPAQNMQMMADGGIAGYDGFDEGPSDFGQGPIMMMSGGGVATGSKEFLRFLQSEKIRDIFAYEKLGPLRKEDLISKFKQARAGAVAAAAAAPAVAPAAAPVTPTTPTAQAAQGSRFRGFNPKGLAGYGLGLYSEDLNQGEDAELERRRAMGPTIDGITAPTAAQQRDALSEQDAAAAVEAARLRAPQPTDDLVADRKDTDRTDPSAGRPATADSSGQFDVAARMKRALGEAEDKADPFEARLREINKARETQAQENVTGLEAINKQFADITKGKRERLGTREGEISKMRDQSLGLALLNAGARMMQTRGSIGEAIGAGIDTGSKQYVAGMERIEAAKDKLATARDKLDEIEAQRGELSAREMHKARNDVKTITTAGMEDLVRAAMAERKMNRTEAIAFVTAQLNADLEVYRQQQTTGRVQMQVDQRADEVAGIRQDQLKLNGLKTRAASIVRELENLPAQLTSTAARRKTLTDALDHINGQIDQLSGISTITPPPGAGGAGGVGGVRPPLESFKR